MSHLAREQEIQIIISDARTGDIFQLGPTGFTWQDFGSRGAAGVVSVRTYQELSSCWKIPDNLQESPNAGQSRAHQ